MLFRHYFEFALTKGVDLLDKKETCLLPSRLLKVPFGKCTVKPVDFESKAGTSSSQSPNAAVGDPIKMRNGKGTPPLLIVRRLMNERENWKEVKIISIQEYFHLLKCNAFFLHLIIPNCSIHLTVNCILCGMMFNYQKGN